jgi:hypothetical protein
VGEMAQALECLTSKHEALTSNPSATKKEIKHFFLSFINILSFFGTDSACGYFFEIHACTYKAGTLSLQAHLYTFHFYFGFFSFIRVEVGF